MSKSINPVPPVLSERAPSRFLVCLIAGAVAGVVVAACMEVFRFGMDCWHSQMTFLDFFHLWRDRVQLGEFAMIVFVNGSVSGAIGGLFTALFSRRTRHPVILMSVWASILGTVALSLFLALAIVDSGSDHRFTSDTALLVAVFLGGGAIYGGTLGFCARLINALMKRHQEFNLEQ